VAENLLGLALPGYFFVLQFIHLSISIHHHAHQSHFDQRSFIAVLLFPMRAQAGRFLDPSLAE
jgi:hypothetical protein